MSPLSEAQRDLLLYLSRCEYATPSLIRRVRGHSMRTVNVLRRRGLVESRSPNLVERIYITDLGREQL